LELEAVGEVPDEVVTLHPAVLARCEQQLANLQDCLCVASGDPQAAQAIRDLIQTVTVSRDGSKVGGVAVEITGQLNALLGDESYPDGRKGVWRLMVAEEGLKPRTREL